MKDTMALLPRIGGSVLTRDGAERWVPMRRTIAGLEADRRPCFGRSRFAEDRSARDDRSRITKRGACLEALRGADPLEASVVGAVALFDGAVSVTHLAQVVDADAFRVQACLDALRDAGLIRVLRFRDRHVRSSVLHDMPVQTIRRLHQAAAAVLFESGACPTIVADHLVCAGDCRHSWAPQVLQSAVDVAIVDDRMDCALRYLELAYRLSRDPSEKAAIAAQLVSIEWRVNPSTATRSFSLLIRALRAGHVPKTYLPLLVRYLLWHGRIAEAQVAIDGLATRASVSETVDTEVYDLRWWVAYSYPELLQTLWPETTGLVAGGPGKPEHAPVSESAELHIMLLANRAGDQIAFGAQRVLKANRLTASSVDALEAAVDSLIYVGRLDVAAAWCDALIAEAVARHAPTWRSMFTIRRSEILLRRGDLDAAATSAITSLNHIPAENLGNSVARAVAVLVLAMTAAGRYGDAAKHLDRQMPDTVFASRYALDYLHARGHYYLATGRVGCARRDFQRAGLLAQRWQMDTPMLVQWRNDLAAVYLQTGDTQRAREYASMHLDRLDGPDAHRSGGVSLRLIAATVGPRERMDLLRESERIARVSGDRLELATVLGDLGRAAELVGDHQGSRAGIRKALDLADRCGALPLRQRLTDDGTDEATDIARLVGKAHRLQELSAAERRVAELASKGKRNKDIAQGLGITISTVEQHLTRVYRKLNVSRRTDLRYVLGGASSDDPALDHAS
jgi:DNA-binding CsgD family transcriptional regulator